MVRDKNTYFHSGGGGFIISHALMKVLYDKGFLCIDVEKQWIDIIGSPHHYLRCACDVAIAYIVQHMLDDVKIVSDRGFRGCSAYNYINSDELKCYCTELNWENVITVHYMESGQMKEFHDYVTSKRDMIINPEWTLITMINRDDMKHPSRYIDFVINLNVNLVIFCSESLISELSSMRGDKPTKIQTYPILSDRIDLVKLTTELNPFSTNFFAWIDCNISVICGPNDTQIYNILKKKREKCSFCYTDFTNWGIMKDHKEYYKIKRKGMVCNFFTGSKSYLLTLHEIVKNKIKEVDNTNLEQLLPNIYYENRDLFHIYFGDYYSTLSNYDHIRTGVPFILHNFIKNTRNYSEHLLAFQACIKLKDDFFLKHCTMSLKNKILLIDELFISAYYLGKYDECYLVLKWLDILSSENGFFSLLNIEHFIRNTDFLWHHLNPSIYNIVEEELSIDSILEKYKGQKIIVYCSHPLSYYSLCHRDIIIRPLDRRL